MSDYIPIDELPPIQGHGTQYPYAEWLKIPEGMALEITDLVDGQPVVEVRTVIAQYFKRHDMPLMVTMRRERLFIVRKAEAPTKEQETKRLLNLAEEMKVR